MITAAHVAVIVAVVMAAVLLRLHQSHSLFPGRRTDTSGGGIMLSSAGRLIVSPGHTIHVIRVQDRLLVVAVHAGGCTLLASFFQKHPGASPEEGSQE
jgi:flagellar biogenesis protein FliO